MYHEKGTEKKIGMSVKHKTDIVACVLAAYHNKGNTEILSMIIKFKNTWQPSIE